MQSAAKLTDGIFKKYRLQINKSKTELMTIDPTGEDENKDSKIWIKKCPDCVVSAVSLPRLVDKPPRVHHWRHRH